MNYVLGLDIGIASIGWAVVEIDEHEMPIALRDTGVRMFKIPQDEKTLESLAQQRREKRASRHLVRHRAQRLRKLRQCLAHNGLPKPDYFKEETKIPLPDVWQLRVEGLTRKLSDKEWTRVLFHMVKHRGYRTQRKNPSSDDKETGQVLSSLSKNTKWIQENKKTPAQLAIEQFLKEDKHIRNRSGNYNHTFNREDIRDELHQLFKAQKQLGNLYTSEDFEQKVSDLLWEQKPAISGDAIQKMLGYCTFEKDQYRAAKNTYSAERFIWLTKLNNLRIYDNGLERSLTQDERNIIIDMPYNNNGKLTYKDIRSALNFSDEVQFKALSKKEEKENSSLIKLDAYNSIRKALTKENLETHWEYLSKQPDLLDSIGEAFSLYKTDDEIKTHLLDKIDNQVINALLQHINFDKFINLSLKALNKILPLMEQGYRYDEACQQIYGNHYGNDLTKQCLDLLPVINTEEIRNPVVLRALSQSRKVINSIIRLYGTPSRIHIETGREIGKSDSERKKIDNQQKQNQKENDKYRKDLEKEFPHLDIKRHDILKKKLYLQQHGKCLYSGKAIDPTRLLEHGYLEVDHALPFSRTWDDSSKNKVLVFKEENQNKKDKIPYEYLDGSNNSEEWRRFVALLKGCDFTKNKKQYLMQSQVDEKGFIERNLNDTRWITRYLCQFIQKSLRLKGNGTNTVFATNGQITAYLRGRWGLTKNREESDRHHALDAVVIACSTPAIQKKITDFIRQKETTITARQKHGGITFPQPWPHFTKEVMLRIFEDSDDLQKLLQEEIPDRMDYIPDNIKPLFVSRMPTRKVIGSAHKDTIKSKSGKVKIKLTDITLEDLEQMVNKDSRDALLYQSIKSRLEEYQGNAQKAFKDPLYKPAKNGESHQVLSITIQEDKAKSGVEVRGGIAQNEDMVRVDVFCRQAKKKEYFLIPIYANRNQRTKSSLPTKAIVPGKEEEQWEEMDPNDFIFSLYPGDLIYFKSKNKDILGYYVSTDRSNGSITIREHDRNKNKGKNGKHSGIGVKLAEQFIKLQIDVLGKEITQCKKEPRLTLNFTPQKEDDD